MFSGGLAAPKGSKVKTLLTYRNLALDIYRSIQWQVMQTFRLRGGEAGHPWASLLRASVLARYPPPAGAVVLQRAALGVRPKRFLKSLLNSPMCR